MKVIFSDRAYVSILAETAEKIPTETGGILLGHRCGDTWYIIESIDPGPNSVFEIAYFVYDTPYVNHLAKKVARLYQTPLSLVGLWHRHPGSFDIFSGTDDVTNTSYAEQDRDGAVSMLVNIDPDFRMTVYHVTLPLKYEKVPYEVGDSHIPSQYISYCNVQDSLDYLAARTDSIRKEKKRLPLSEDDIQLFLGRLKDNLVRTAASTDDVDMAVLDDSDIETILECTERDMDYLAESRFDILLGMDEQYLRFIENSYSQVLFEFCMDAEKNCYMHFMDHYWKYEPELIKNHMHAGNAGFWKNLISMIEQGVNNVRKIN